jgi:hypothetical protein
MGYTTPPPLDIKMQPEGSSSKILLATRIKIAPDSTETVGDGTYLGIEEGI